MLIGLDVFLFFFVVVVVVVAFIDTCTCIVAHSKRFYILESLN